MDSRLLQLVLLLGFFALLSVNAAGSSSKFPFLQEASSYSTSEQYDYIIVGGGTAGCPLAATLSQKFKVLVLERGGVPYGNPNIERMDLFVENLSQCNATSPAQAFTSEDGVLNRRARVLGGGTCLNAGFYSRASKEFILKAGWDGKLVEESYTWVEKVVAFVPQLKQWQLAVRKGLLNVGILPDNGATYDHIVGTKTGGSIFDNDGKRHTAADLLKYANPSKINVLLHATVTKILSAGRPRAYGVAYTDSTGARHQALLNSNPSSEVIVSSGALGSPQLLLLSGIGPKEHLSDFKIPLVMDAPGVGQGMADNPMNAIFVPSPRPLEVALVEVVGITRFGSFIESASPRNLSALAGLLPMLAPAVGMLSSVPPGSRSQELAESFQNQLLQSADAKLYLPRAGFLLEKVDGPLSSGYLKLRNTDINDNPIVRFNYFANSKDLDKCIRGIRLIEKLILSPPMTQFRYTDISKVPAPMVKLVKFIGNLLPGNTSDTAKLGAFCKETVTTIWHYHGGCQVGRVVDQNLRVFGVDNLRIVDGSTFLSSPGTNPQATNTSLLQVHGFANTQGAKLRP